MARVMLSTTIGWIGTGVMGAPMCGQLLAAGYRVTVFNRSRERALRLLERGAQWADSPRALAEGSHVVFTMVGFPRDVREVTLGPDGALGGARPGTILVDMTTSEPSLAREIYESAKARGVSSVDAPVSGGEIGAREARLSIMAGGDRDAFDALRPLFERMGRTIEYQGPAGCGQHTKLLNQILIASGMVGLCEALLYGRKAGLDLPSVLRSVSSGAAGSWLLSHYGPRILEGDFGAGFFVEHFVKDLAIALAEARRAKLALPGLALAHELYAALEAQGHSRKGVQALIFAVSKLSDLEWR